MRTSRVAVAAAVLGLLAATLLVVAGQPAQAKGKHGPVAWGPSMASAASLCTYDGRSLTAVRVTPPRAAMDKALARQGGTAQYVGVRTTLQGLSGGRWRTVVKRPSKRAYAASALVHPRKLRSVGHQALLTFQGAALKPAYSAFREKVTLQWYAYNGRTIRGSVSRTSPSCVRTKPPVAHVMQVVGGSGYACALMNDQSVRCWGYNGNGRVGNGSTAETELHPVTPTGMTSGVTSLSIGAVTTCAVKSQVAYCWGRGEVGQLGNGTTSASQSTPTPLSGLTRASKVFGGSYMDTCATSVGQPLKCWGANADGQVGNGKTGNVTTPTAVSNMAEDYASTASTGETSGCAIGGGDVWCWGHNNTRQLGTTADTNSTTVHTKTEVPGVSSASQVAVGTGHACAVEAGAAACWGWDNYGQVGNGAHTGTSAPVVPAGLSSGVSAVAADGAGSCAVKSGRVYCWGYNGNRQVDPESASNPDTPTLLAGPTNVVGVTLSAEDGYAWDAAGDVWAWGDNTYGQLGTGNTLAYTSAVRVSIQ